MEEGQDQPGEEGSDEVRRRDRPPQRAVPEQGGHGHVRAHGSQQERHGQEGDQGHRARFVCSFVTYCVNKKKLLVM